MQTDQSLTSSPNTTSKLELPPSTLKKQETAKISPKTSQKKIKLSPHLLLLSMPSGDTFGTLVMLCKILLRIKSPKIFLNSKAQFKDGENT